MMINSIGSGSAVQFSLNTASKLMDGAAASIASGDLDGLVDAGLQMSQAKIHVGIAAKLSQAQDEMMVSTLSILA